MPISNDNIVSSGEPTGKPPISVKNPRKKRKIFRKIFLLLFLLFILILIFIQTSLFKNWLLQYGVDEINKLLVEKESVLSIGRIEGSILKDLKLFNISLTVKKDTIFKLDLVDIEYSLSGLVQKKIEIKSLILDKPEINFTKILNKKDSLIWNISYLLESEKKEEDTTTSEFDWEIFTDNFEVKNGAFRSLDIKNINIPIREAILKNVSHLKADSLDVTALNIKLNAQYLPNDKKINVENISFRTNSSFNLNGLSFNASLDKNDVAKLENLNLKTDKSNIEIKIASIENLNPLKNKIDYFDFQKKNFIIDIITNKFDFDDLTYFLPDINFMNGKVYLYLKANGNYSNFKMDEFIVTLPFGTTLDINGRVKNLHDPSKLYFDVDCKNAVLNPRDEEEITPGLPIPDFSHIGVVNANFKFVGEPLKFNAEASLKSSAGDAEVKGFLDITQNDLLYDAKATTNNVDIGRIVKDEKLRSQITGEFIVAGRGVDYRTMTNKISYSIKNTSMFDQKIESSSGVINSNSGDIDLDLDYKSNTGFIKVDGKINVKDINNLAYNLKGNVKNLNIATFSKNSENGSNLNFGFDVSGNGTDIDNLTGKLNIDMAESMFSNYFLPTSQISVEFAQNDTGRIVKLASNLMDMTASGKFKFLELPEILSNNINQLTNQISQNLNKDTLGFLSDLEKSDFRVRSYANNDYSTDISYNIKIKSLLPLNLILGDSSLVFKCDIRGRLLNNENTMVFSVAGRFEDFKYGDTTLLFRKSIVRVFLKNNYNSNMPFTFLTDINARASNLYTNGISVDTLGIDLNTSSYLPTLSAFVQIDSTKSFYTQGAGIFLKNVAGIQFDTMNFHYDDYRFNNSEPVVAKYVVDDTGEAKNHFSISSFKLTDGNQRLNISGVYSLNGFSNISLSADRISIAKLQKYLIPDIEKNNIINGNIRRFKIDYKGTFENPELIVEANTDFLSSQKIKLGRIDAIVDYKNNLLEPQIAFYNPNNIGSLIIDGSLPYDNPLIKNEDDEDSNDILLSPVDLKIASKDFQIKILEQFIPVISNLKGRMNGDIDIKGIVKTPLLSGNLEVKNGSFNFDMTGVNYDFDAFLTTEKQKLNFTDFKIRHKTAKNKIMNMNGYIDFSNLSFNDMELRIRGEGKLLDESITQNVMGVYGNLFGKTSNDLVLKGNAENLYMSGDIDITEGRISIIPQYKVAYNIFDDNFIYRVKIDSSLLKNDSLFLAKYNDSLSMFEKSKLDPFDSYFKVISDSSELKAKNSNFKYLIKVKTLKDIYCKLLIEEKSGQEFTGNVSANITFDNLESPSFSTRGRVDIGENAFYKFYKSFLAEGYVLFTGDVVNPELYIKGLYSTKSADPNNPNSTREVEIKLDVNGNAMNPKLKWEVLSNRSTVGGSDPTDDAISFIVFGKFKDELNADQRLSMFSSVGANVGTSFASNYVSDIINTYLPFIVKTDITYNDNQKGTFAENTDIRLTAQFAGATIILGGQILRDLSNTNFLIEYPLNNIFGINNVSQNLILQLERYFDPFSQNNILSNDSRTGGALFYRIKF